MLVKLGLKNWGALVQIRSARPSLNNDIPVVTEV
ncbi:hypothetical protein JOC26_001241 [Sporohalobacter salinus]|nr:hypothetical protein [Sporohalobacter salinus]